MYTDEYQSTWMSYLSVSDAAGNFADDTDYDDNGYPTDLFAPPVGGTTFLARSFDTGSSGGMTETTRKVVSGVDGDVSSLVWSDAGSGITGSSYYYNNTATVNGASSGNSDTVSWNISQQSTGSYGGGDSGSLGVDANEEMNGSKTTTGNSSGQSLSSTTLSDEYERNGGGVDLGGTLTISSRDTSPQWYSSGGSETQAYSANELTADNVQYNNGSGGATTTTVSNNDGYTLLTPFGFGGGGDFYFSTGWNQGESTASGSNDLLARTGSGTSRNIASSGGMSIGFSSSAYAASDGSFSSSGSSFLATTGSALSLTGSAGRS